MAANLSPFVDPLAGYIQIWIDLLTGTPLFWSYKELGLTPQASWPEVRRRYRSLASRFHPDNKKTGDERMFRRIKAAFDAIKDSVERGTEWTPEYPWR